MKQTKDQSWLELSKKGGDTTLKKHGKTHYATISKAGGAKLKELKTGTDYYKKLSALGVKARKIKKEKLMLDKPTAKLVK